MGITSLNCNKHYTSYNLKCKDVKVQNLYQHTNVISVECTNKSYFVAMCNCTHISLQTDIFGSFVYLDVFDKDKFAIISDKIFSSVFLPIDTNKEIFYLDSTNLINSYKHISVRSDCKLLIYYNSDIVKNINISSGSTLYFDSNASLSNVRFRILGEVDNNILLDIDNKTLNDIDYITIG